MALRSIFDELKDDIVGAGADVYGYSSTESPLIDFSESGIEGHETANAFIDSETGKITLMEPVMLRTMSGIRKLGYKPDFKQFLVHVLSEEVSHYYHLKSDPATSDERLSAAERVKDAAISSMVLQVIDEMENLVETEMYLETVGKAGMRFIEESMGQYDERLHEVNNVLRTGSIKGVWKGFSVMMQRISGPKLYERAPQLSTVFQAYYMDPVQVASSVLSKKIFDEGLQRFQNLVKTRDRSVVDINLYKRISGEMFPGAGSFKYDLCKGFIIARGA